MLTKTELAKQAGIPASSLTYYIEQYGEYFDAQYVSGRRYPTYPEESIKLAQLIRDLIGQRMNSDEIHKELEAKGYFPIVEYVETTNLEKRNHNDRDSIVEFDNIATLEASLKAVQVLNRMNDELHTIINKQETEIEELKTELEEKNQIIEDLQSK